MSSQQNEISQEAARALLTACKDYVNGRKDARECEAEMRSAIARAEGTDA